MATKSTKSTKPTPPTPSRKKAPTEIAALAPEAITAETVRPVSGGDVAPTQTLATVAEFVAQTATDAAQTKIVATAERLLGTSTDATVEERAKGLRAILEGASPDDAKALRLALLGTELDQKKAKKINPDEELAPDWRDGAYPYKNLIRRSTYEAAKFELQVELLKLQAWVKETGQRVVILFEGRDAAGKGGTIKRFMEHLNPRGARVVALEKPTDLEKGQWYFQRYVQHLPTAG